MPRLVNLGVPYGVVAWPDDATDDQILADYSALEAPPPRAADISPSDYVKNITGNVVRGATREFGALPKAIGIGAAELARKTGGDIVVGEGDITDPKQRATYQLGQAIEDIGKAAPDQVPGLEESFWATKVPQAVGSGIGFLAGGGLGRAGIGLLRKGVTSAATRAAETAALKAATEKGAPLALKAAGAASAGAEIAGLGAASQFGSAYEDALSKGADRDTALKAGLLNLPIGASEILPLGNMLNRLDKFTGGSFSQYLRAATKETFEEALQEAAQNFASNVVEKNLYNPAKDLLDGLAQEAGAGGVSGFLLSTLTHALGGVRARYEKPSEEGYLRKQSAQASEERVKQAIARREEQDAQSIGTVTQTPSQQTQGLEQETQERLRLRSAEENRVEAQPGAVTPPPLPPAPPTELLSPAGTEPDPRQAQRIREVTAFAPQEGGPEFRPVNWQAVVEPDGTANWAKLRAEVESGNINGGTVANPLLLHFLQRSDLHPVSIRFIDINPDQSADLTQTGTKFYGRFRQTTLNTPAGLVSAGPAQIEVITRGFDNKTISQAELVATLNHELAHNNVSNKWRTAGPQVLQDLQDLLAFVQAKSEGTQFAGHNVLANIDEFLAEAFTNPQVQAWLGSLDYSQDIRRMGGKPVIPAAPVRNSVFRQLLTLIKRILRLPDFITDAFGNRVETITALDQAISLGAKLERLPAPGVSASEVVNYSPATPPGFFRTRQQVEAAVANPGLTAEQQQQARDLAAVQSSMAPDNLVAWIMGQTANDAEAHAKKRLDYIEDRRYLSDQPLQLLGLPAGTPDEQRAVEVAGATVLGHYGLDRSVDRAIDRDLEADQQAMAVATQKLAKQSNAQLKANFLTGLFNDLTRQYRIYLNNQSAAAPAAANLQAQWRERLAAAERRLNEQVASPTALKKALSVMATAIPENLLQAGTTNQQVIDWANQQAVLHGQVGDQVRNWMLVDDGTGSPAMLNYTSLVADLAGLRDVLNNQLTLSAEIKAFEQWFNPSGVTGQKISAKRFAENYFKFRTSRDRALRIARTIEKEINDLDTRIHGNTIAGDKLQEMMRSPDYVSSVRLAADRADVVVRALYDSLENKTGLIERDRTVGLWRMKGPETGFEYIVDLYPSSSQEAQNRTNLADFASEARLYASKHAQDDPLLSDEYVRLADYIEKFLIHPSLDPAQGFTQLPWVGIPGTSIRFNPDIFFDGLLGLNVAASGVGFSLTTIKDTLERIGGRAVQQAVRDGYELDTVMRKIEATNANPEYGYAAMTQAIIKAIKSHGWSSDMFPLWDEKVAERVLAAGQNNLSPGYEVGNTVIGSDVVLTQEDVAALKIMKRWEDSVLAAAPNNIQGRLGDLGISRKAIGNGRYTMARIAAPWTRHFVVNWGKAATDADRLDLLKNQTLFGRVVMGYLGEFNPEFDKMNPASPDKSPLFALYRLLAQTEKAGIQTFHNMDEVLDFLASEMVAQNIAQDLATARKAAASTLFSEIGDFVRRFETNVINYKTKEVWGGVPEAVINTATANNAFTTPRGLLQAPSTFYSYSTGSDGRRWTHIGGLRSLLNLQLLQSGREAQTALETKKAQYEQEISDLQAAGQTKRQAKRTVLKESAASRKANEIRFDYRELLTALQSLEQAFGNLERYEASTADHYQHAGVAALNNTFGTVKSFLLSSVQAITTNFWSGTLMGPAMMHWQTGQYFKAFRDALPAPHMWKTLMRRVASAVEGNPAMSKLLKQHSPLFLGLAENVIKASADWRRMQTVAQISGMVTPYNLGNVLRNKAALKQAAGRLEAQGDDPGVLAGWSNAAGSTVGLRHVAEGLKATTPRFFDNLVNYTLIAAFEQETEFLKRVGWAAFQAREAAAANTGVNYSDLSIPGNVLQPGDLGLRSYKFLERYRQLFVPLGSLDWVLLDYYERTKNMTPEQREAEPLIPDPDDYAGLALQYAAQTNVATETNRPYSMKGKGSDGVWRNIAGTFLGWPINFMKQLAKVFQSHSKDPKFNTWANNMLSLTVIVVLLAAIGAWNWEFGDELSKLAYDTSSARIQPGNVVNAAKEGDYRTAATYVAQALVNTVPIIGPALGSLVGVSFTGRGQPFDLTSLSPQIGFAADSWNTVKRIIQTGDVALPMADFTRRWAPFTKIAINRLPLMRGLVEQQNAVRSLNGSAPPGTEIKWGQRGGNVQYGPANDEIQKMIAAAYEAAHHGGNIQEVETRMNAAVAAYVRAGRSEEDAIKAVAGALSSKEPIRILTGKEFTAEEEERWVKRMTPQQKADYDRATAAWEVLSAVTGKDLNMVTTGVNAAPGFAAVSGPYAAPTQRTTGFRGGFSAPRVTRSSTSGYLRPSSPFGSLRPRRPSLRPRRSRGGGRVKAAGAPQVATPRTRLGRLRRLNRRTGRRRQTSVA